MPEYDNTNTVVAWPNKDKTEGDNRPDFTGKVNVDGVERRIAFWVQEREDDESYLSGKVTEYQDKAGN